MRKIVAEKRTEHITRRKRHSNLLSSVAMSPLAPRCRMSSMSIGRGPSMEESLEFMNNWKDAAKERGFKLKLSGHR